MRSARFGFAALLCGALTLRAASARGEGPQPWLGESSRLPASGEPLSLGLLQSLGQVPLESAGLLALVTYTGFRDWKWGTAAFRFNSEGWFGMETGSGGVDKLGHAYGAYMSSELLYFCLRARHERRWVRSLYPPLFSTLLFQYIEFFDAYSVDHGYSYEDTVLNLVGAGLSYLRSQVPGFRRTFDFRLAYYPSGGRSFQPLIDYEGQKFFGVIKLAGVPGLERTPFRYLELLGGYYSRGFLRYSRAPQKTEHFVVGLGLSLSQLLWGPLEQSHGEPFSFLNLASGYVQPPLFLSSERVRSAPR